MIADFFEDHLDLAYSLVISGLDVEYTSDEGYPSRPFPIDAGTYRQLAVLTYASPITGRLDTTRAVAEYGHITIELGTAGDEAETEDDPGIALCRVDHSDATRWARLIKTVPEALFDPAELHVDRDVSGWGPFPRTIQLGSETIRVNGTAGIGTEADPYRFVGIARRRRHSAPQRHVTNTLDSLKPFVLSEPCFWRWRRATLYARPRYPDGTFGDEIEMMRGFLAGPGEQVAEKVMISLMPLTAVLDRKPSGFAERSQLVPDFRYAEGSAATTFEHVQYLAGGDGYSAITTLQSDATDELLFVPTETYEDVFDIDLPIEHPRHGQLSAGRALSRNPPESILGADRFELLPGYPWADVAIRTIVQNSPLSEVVSADVIEPRAGVAALKSWPDDYLAALRAGWSASTHLGADGRWVGVSIRPDGQMLFSLNAQPLSHITLVFQNTTRVWPAGVGTAPRDRGPNRNRLHYPIDFAAPDDERVAPPLVRVAGETSQHWERIERVDGTETRADTRGVCPGGWYQSGERYITCDRALLLPTHGTATVEISYYPRGSSEAQTAYARIVAVVEPAPGIYAYEVHPADRDSLPSFGDWGAQRATLTPSVRFDAQPDRDVLLTILHSNGGQAATDPTWDREAFGAGLLTEDVDASSFAAIAAPPELDRWSPILEDGRSLREVIEPILLATSSAIVIRHDEQGRCRLARVHIGLESSAESVLTVADGDWAATKWPADGADLRIVNRYEIRANFDDDDKPQATLKFNDAASIAAMGEGETLKADMRGLWTDPADPNMVESVVRNLIARWAGLHAYPRRRGAASLGIGQSHLVGLGSTIVVSSRVLRGPGKGWGYKAKGARVINLHRPLFPRDGSVTDLAFATRNVKSNGINASALIESVPVEGDPPALSTSAFIVKALHFAPPLHPLTGAALSDLDFFAEGDRIYVYQLCDEDNGVEGVITSIDRATRRVEGAFVDADDNPTAHGIIGPLFGIMVPVTYDAASTNDNPAGFSHKELAFIADEAATLGTDGDRGDQLL